MTITNNHPVTERLPESPFHGIVSDVFAADALESAMDELCAALKKAPRPGILGIKEYAHSALSMDISSAVDFARNLPAAGNSAPGMRG